MKNSDILKLVAAVGVSLGAGVIGSLFTAPSIPTWYATLVQPAWNPPAWIFAPVWTTLYILMGVAAFLVWQGGQERREVRAALGLFIGQLALNALWSILFFGLHAPGTAFLDIVLMWLAIVATMIAFARVSRKAAYLLVPYLLWVSFATYLNCAIWLLN